jgi:hypothetical protein
MGPPEAELRFAGELRMFLAPRHRSGRALVTCDGTSTLGHVIESLGVPLTGVKADVEPSLRPGTRRTYQEFARCTVCGQVYWRGARSARLAAIVDRAARIVADRC